MSYLEELLPKFRKGAKIRCKGWDENVYIEMKKGVGFVSNNRGRKYIFTYEDFNHACWELYKELEPEPDWDYIIKNKCLCWFWDEEESEAGKTAGELIEIRKDISLPFIKVSTIKGYSTGYSHCCPVRRDEVTFYEDRKDEHI